MTQILSLRDGCLDILEELGRCAAQDFVILVFWQGMIVFRILICKDNNFFLIIVMLLEIYVI